MCWTSPFFLSGGRGTHRLCTGIQRVFSPGPHNLGMPTPNTLSELLAKGFLDAAPMLLKSTWYVWVLCALCVALKARQNQREAALRKSWVLHERVEAHLRSEAIRQANLWRREG